MRKFLHLTVTAVAVAAALLVAACGSTAPAPAATTAPAAKPAAAEPTKAAAPAAAAPAATTAPAAPAAAAKPAVTYPKMDIKLGHAGVTDMSYHKGNVKFSELVKERSGGNINIQVFPNSQLGSEKDMVEQVKNGVIQFALTSTTFLSTFEGWGPSGSLIMPYVIPGATDEEQYPKLMKLIRSPLFQDVAENGAKVSGLRAVDLGWWYGTRNLTNNKRPVVTPDDVKGLKIRTMDSPIGKAALTALGAATTPMAVAELYSAMQMGVVDGQENPYNTIYSSKYYEVQKYLSTTGHMTMTVLILTNDKWWQGLAPEVRELLSKAVQDAGEYQSDVQLKANKQNLEDLKAKGMQVSEVNKKDFAERTKDAWKEFEPMFGKGFYEKVKAEADKL
ncbi:MAG TPA: TRAP transporter substrate-binding protein [Chloroflexota bacterium]|nr:TRAP transporter substrate-binding protein [Chloroflexota bacterium]